MSVLRTFVPPAARVRGVGVHIGLLLVVGLTLLPLAWALLTSVTPRTELFTPGLLPRQPTLEHYRAALDALPIGQLLVNTTLIAGSVASIQVLLATLGAYAVTRFDFRGRGLAFALMTGSILIPQQTLVVPSYLLVAELGWVNTYLGLIVPQVATAGVGVFLLCQHMAQFPRELVDAAEMEGATDWEILWRVIVPNLWPAILALEIILFVQTWNEYLWPLLITRGQDVTTIQIGLRIFRSEQGSQWGPLMAASAMASAPLLLAYAVAQRRIVDAFIRGGLR